MIRGTTPQLEFAIPFDTSLLQDAYITFTQCGKVVLDKPMCDCTVEPNKLTVKLTQEETLKLSCDGFVKIQIRAKAKDNTALASNIINVSVGEILKDGVI